MSYILNHIEAKCVFVGDEKKLESILSILDELQFLELIVTFQGLGWKNLYELNLQIIYCRLTLAGKVTNNLSSYISLKMA